MKNALTVIVILLLLLLCGGLLLPMVSKVRDPANRMACTNNLKQLGLALHNYHDTHGVLPRATMPNEELTPDKRLSFHVALLPYLESDNLYSSLNLKQSWDAVENRTVAGVSVRILVCPSSDLNTMKAGMGSYVGVAGIGADAALLPLGDPSAGFFGHSRGLTLRPGVRRKDDPTRTIEDGAANTIAVTETIWKNGPWIAGDYSTIRGLDAAAVPHLGVDRTFGAQHIAENKLFGRSLTGANFAFADGSVRFLREDVAPATLEALATIAGGEKVDPNDY